MVICPIAIAVGCRKCPILGVCPVKELIGDYEPNETAKNPPPRRPVKVRVVKRR